jgi:hypothetical protein
MCKYMSCNKDKFYVLYQNILPSCQNEVDSSSSKNYAERVRSSLETQQLHNLVGSFQQKDVPQAPTGSYEVSSCGFQNLGSAHPEHRFIDHKSDS